MAANKISHFTTVTNFYAKILHFPLFLLSFIYFNMFHTVMEAFQCNYDYSC